MSDQIPNFFYRLLPNGKGWYWELVDTKNAVVERGIADERARGHALKVAQELGRHGSPLGGKSISDTDEKGVVVFKTDIPDE